MPTGLYHRIKRNSGPIGELAALLKNADAVVVGAGSGLSAAAGLMYSGERFTANFREFIERYGLRDMYSAGFTRFLLRKKNGLTGAGIFTITVMMWRPENPIWICTRF